MKTRLLFFVFAFAILGILGCETLKDIFNPKYEPPVLAKHKTHPPIAESVEFKQIDSNLGNLLFKAKFKKGTVTTQKRTNRFTTQIGGETIVLRDDGKKGDEVKKDGIYSVILNEDLNAVNRHFENKFDKLRNEEQLGFFRGREFIKVNQSELEKEFGFDKNFQNVLNPNNFGQGLNFAFNPSIFALTGSIPEHVKTHSLMVTDLDVVEDPTRIYNPCDNTGTKNGVWTFGELMRQLASPSPTSIATDATTIQFILDFLNTWDANNTVNGELIPARSNINNIIADWRALSGTTTNAGLKLENFPAKLTAIVNRLDLRGNLGYSGNTNSGGEGRFVFCLLNPSFDAANNVTGCAPLPFNIIFEYGIPIFNCQDLKLYAKKWWDLQAFSLGSVGYNNRLEAITNVFTKSGSKTSNTNQSSLNQIRTNEIALSGPWELREFNLLPNSSGPATLQIVTVKQEPATKFNNKATPPTINETDLADWINANEIAVINERHVVPEVLPGSFNNSNFLGGHALTRLPILATTPSPPASPLDNVPHHWDASFVSGTSTITNPEARHKFSLNTCSGCHGGETECQAFFPHNSNSGQMFVHIGFVPFGSEAGLSGFLTGQGIDDNAGDNDGDHNGQFFVDDAAGNGQQRPFNDLERRGADLRNFVLSHNCFSIFVVPDGLEIFEPDFIPNPPIVSPEIQQFELIDLQKADTKIIPLIETLTFDPIRATH